MHPDNFVLAKSFCRSQCICGRVSIVVPNNNVVKKLNLDTFCKELHFDVTGIVLVEVNMIEIILYRSPKGKTDILLPSLECLLRRLVSLKVELLFVVM